MFFERWLTKYGGTSTGGRGLAPDQIRKSDIFLLYSTAFIVLIVVGYSSNHSFFVLSVGNLHVWQNIEESARLIGV